MYPRNQGVLPSSPNRNFTSTYCHLTVESLLRGVLGISNQELSGDALAFELNNNPNSSIKNTIYAATAMYIELMHQQELVVMTLAAQMLKAQQAEGDELDASDDEILDAYARGMTEQQEKQPAEGDLQKMLTDLKQQQIWLEKEFNTNIVQLIALAATYADIAKEAHTNMNTVFTEQSDKLIENVQKWLDDKEKWLEKNATHPDFAKEQANFNAVKEEFGKFKEAKEREPLTLKMMFQQLDREEAGDNNPNKKAAIMQRHTVTQNIKLATSLANFVKYGAISAAEAAGMAMKYDEDFQKEVKKYEANKAARQETMEQAREIRKQYAANEGKLTMLEQQQTKLDQARDQARGGYVPTATTKVNPQ